MYTQKWRRTPHREVQRWKISYMLVGGEREQEAGTVAVRRHGEGNQGAIPLGAFMDQIREEIDAALQRR